MVLSSLQTTGTSALSTAVAKYVAATGLLGVVAWYVTAYYASPLRRFPGPALAGWTNWWRYWLVRSGQYQFRIRELHAQYGPVVRIGPNVLDFDYPELVKTIYTSTEQAFRKTEFYDSSNYVENGQVRRTVFSAPDPAEHAVLKKPIIKAYSIGSILSMEGMVDQTVADWCAKIDGLIAANDGVVDLGRWLEYFTWDIISEITFGKRFGFLHHGCDHNGLLKSSESIVAYFATVGQIPVLDSFFAKNPVFPVLSTGFGAGVSFCLQSLMGRKKQRAAAAAAAAAVAGEKQKQPGSEKQAAPEMPENDMLDRFLNVQAENPASATDGVIFSATLVNFLAGADSTAETLKAAVYFLATNPRVLHTLRAAVHAVIPPTATVTPANTPSYAAARAVSYLEAVVRETFRMMPAVGMMLERYVPAAGLQLPRGGGFVPRGTIVGMNAYIVGRNAAVYGDDVDVFRPERWLRADGESEAAFEERVRSMAAVGLEFGAGPRVCIGKNLALVEIYKVLAVLAGRYEMLLDKQEEYTVESSWFIKQRGLTCRMHVVE